jgi:hypothetical protein
VVPVQVEVQQVHEREEMSDVERAGGRVDAGVDHEFLGINEGTKLAFWSTRWG